MLDPQVLLDAVRDSDGRVVDFLYVEVNRATSEYLGLSRDELLGSGLMTRSPGIAEAGLFVEYVRCLDTGEPVVHDDFTYDNEILGDSRRYDIRASRATGTSISLTWRDVTERFQMARDAARADALFRRLMEASAIGMGLFGISGQFDQVNAAMCDFFGYDLETLRTKTWQELTAPAYLDADLKQVDEVLAGHIESYRMDKQYIHADGHLIWGDLSVSCLRRPGGEVEYFVVQIIDVTEEVAGRAKLREAQRQQALIDARYRRSIDNAAVGMCTLTPQGRTLDVNSAMCNFFGSTAEEMIGKHWRDVTGPEYVEEEQRNWDGMVNGRTDSYRMIKHYNLADGQIIWGDLAVSGIRDDNGHLEYCVALVTDITDRVTAEQAVAEASAQQAAIDSRYRRSIDNAAVGMCTVTAEGQLGDANDALCQFFGYDADAINGTYWQDFAAPEYLEEELNHVRAIVEGRSDSYRMVKRYTHADGHSVWGVLTVSAVRDGNGNAEYLVALITDITAQVESDERNRALSEVIQQQSDRLTSELRSAATYVSSILPGDLDGPVRVSARYLPSQELAGDIFDYRWIDDDHLIVYLIDVSGHGIEPALLSVSVHNLLRSGSLPLPTLLAPDQVLAELNRLFQMDNHDGNYLTMWCGVYELSTRTLRYASAGTPPAFAITPDATTATELSTDGQPLGMFDDAAYDSRTYTVSPGCRILIYSDGAYESALDHDRQLSMADFNKLFTRLAGSPLDDLIETLRGLTPSGTFEDDCTLVNLEFD